MTAVLTAELLRLADSFLDTDEQHQAAIILGASLFGTFGADKEGRISTQVRNLQQMAVSATRFADIEDFIKSQMGRKAGAYREWRKEGDETLRQLGELRKAAEGLTTDEGQRLLLRLHLARGWVRAVVGAYLYSKAQKEMEQSRA
jgi:3-deoxy-D-arabino-heptulosonate 7-phosphate (DAHP) synthase class II